LERGRQDRITYQMSLTMLVSIRQLSFISSVQTWAQDPGSKARNLGVVFLLWQALEEKGHSQNGRSQNGLFLGV